MSWSEMEEEIASLLPSEGHPSDRPRLLQRLSDYAALVVQAAHRLGADLPTPAERERALVWLDRPVFVCGHHRTGTTLLHGLLDGHPELCVLPSEGTYLTSFSYVAGAGVPLAETARFTGDWICRFVDPNYEPHFLLGRSSREDDNPSLRFARRLLGWQRVLSDAWPDRAAFTHLLALVVAYRDIVAPAQTPRSWVEKTPLNEARTDVLVRAFPAARFIQLVRDPGDTLASLLGAGAAAHGPGQGALRHAWRISRSLRLARHNRARLAARYLVVRYEDLARAPAGETERVRAFLEVGASATLVTPTVQGVPVRSNSSFDRGAAGVVVPPRARGPGGTAWIGLVRYLLRFMTRPLGYEASLRSTSSSNPSKETT